MPATKPRPKRKTPSVAAFVAAALPPRTRCTICANALANKATREFQALRKSGATSLSWSRFMSEHLHRNLRLRFIKYGALNQHVNVCLGGVAVDPGVSNRKAATAWREVDDDEGV